MQETTVTTQDMRAMMDSMHQQLMDTYRLVRSNEANTTVRMCGFHTAYDLWSFEQKNEIIKALNRGKEGRYMQALERFGYAKTRATKRGVGFRHIVFPDLYAPLTITASTDVFTDWPVELINQIYLNDVVLYKRNIVYKSRMTRWVNDKNRKRSREEILDMEAPKRVC